jgi:uncharacterized membrane protein HdeD (DUF308 family)
MKNDRSFPFRLKGFSVSTATPNSSVLSVPRAARIAWVRAAAALAWAGALVVALGGDPDAAASVPTAAAVLLVAYPLIDVVSSAVEASERPASARALPIVNALISLAASVGLGVAAAGADAGTTLAVFGAWAIVSGAVQLGTAAMRRRAGGRELPMIVSGAISTVAGVSFVAGSSSDVAHLTSLAGYAAFGAVLYLVWAARSGR